VRACLSTFLLFIIIVTFHLRHEAIAASLSTAGAVRSTYTLFDAWKASLSVLIGQEFYGRSHRLTGNC
jgi:hypothetical protein